MEAEIKRMESLCKDFENGTISQEVIAAIPEIAEKIAEQEKLKYRLTIMRRAVVAKQ